MEMKLGDQVDKQVNMQESKWTSNKEKKEADRQGGRQ